MADIWGGLVQTEDGTFTIRHPDYDEEFHSKQGARYEAESLYRDASGFGEKIRQESVVGQDWAILDVGLGLGYNALMTIETWWRAGGPVSLHLISLEQSLALVEALRDPHCAWKQGWSSEWRAWTESLQVGPIWQARIQHPDTGRCLDWSIHVGDARLVDLPTSSLNFIWQDAFSPKKNPELWTPQWFDKLKRASRDDVCLVTYSVARVVKDSLLEAGWTFQRLKASERKKQWLRASLSSMIERS